MAASAAQLGAVAVRRGVAALRVLAGRAGRPAVLAGGERLRVRDLVGAVAIDACRKKGKHGICCFSFPVVRFGVCASCRLNKCWEI